MREETLALATAGHVGEDLGMGNRASKTTLRRELLAVRLAGVRETLRRRLLLLHHTLRRVHVLLLLVRLLLWESALAVKGRRRLLLLLLLHLALDERLRRTVPSGDELLLSVGGELRELALALTRHHLRILRSVAELLLPLW